MRASTLLYRVLVGTHLWIGLGAAVQVFLAYKSFDASALSRTQLYYTLAVGLLATGFYTTYRRFGESFALRRRAAMGRIWSGLLWLLGASLLLVNLPSVYVTQLLFPAGLAGGYAWARYSGCAQVIFGYAKPLLLALVWTWVVCYIPLLATDEVSIPVVLSRLAFFLGIGLVSDYKDHIDDRRSGLETLGNHLGVKRIAILSIGLMGLSAGLVLLVGGANQVPALAFGASGAWGMAVFLYAFRQNPAREYYDLYVDGLLVLAGVLYLGLSTVR